MNTSPVKDQSLVELVRIGQLLQALTYAQKTVEDADGTIEDLLGRLESVDLPHTFGAAQQLRNYQREVLRKRLQGNSLNTSENLELNSIARTVIESLHHEAAAQRTVVVDSSAVAESLARLPQRLAFLTEAQTHLRSETIRCLECRAYRAAIVMCWSFAFDYVRHWVFSNHLTPFNDKITEKYTTTRNGQQQPVYDRIQQYSDFWENRPAPGDRTFLDTCEAAGIIVGKPYDSLVGFLRRRNDYAHPNFKTPDVDLTKGYIAELLSVIVSDPFPKPSAA